jgi:hypothetical protein
MITADRVIRWTTAGAVVGVVAVAAIASYEHAYALMRAHGEAGSIAHLVPLTVDGLMYAGSMVLLDSARRKIPLPGLAWWLLAWVSQELRRTPDGTTRQANIRLIWSTSHA